MADVVLNGSTALAVMPQNEMLADLYDEGKLSLLRETLVKDFNRQEFDLFISFCRSVRLNPFLRQIYGYKIGGKPVFHVSIDGLCAKAAESREYAGMDDVIFDTEKARPNKATCTVYRITQGLRVPFTATVYMKEREQNNQNWREKPFTMLGKCARAACLRLGFPAETAGLYITEELPPANVVESKAQASSVTVNPAMLPEGQEPPLAPPTGKSWQEWTTGLAKELGIFDGKEEYQNFILELTGTDPRKGKLSVEQWQKLAHYLLNAISEVKASAANTVDAEAIESEGEQ